MTPGQSNILSRSFVSAASNKTSSSHEDAPTPTMSNCFPSKTPPKLELNHFHHRLQKKGTSEETIKKTTNKKDWTPEMLKKTTTISTEETVADTPTIATTANATSAKSNDPSKSLSPTGPTTTTETSNKEKQQQSIMEKRNQDYSNNHAYDIRSNDYLRQARFSSDKTTPIIISRPMNSFQQPSMSSSLVTDSNINKATSQTSEKNGNNYSGGNNNSSIGNDDYTNNNDDYVMKSMLSVYSGHHLLPLDVWLYCGILAYDFFTSITMHTVKVLIAQLNHEIWNQTSPSSSWRRRTSSNRRSIRRILDKLFASASLSENSKFFQLRNMKPAINNNHNNNTRQQLRKRSNNYRNNVQKIHGVQNYGQTCFLNSVLQALASLESFVLYLELIVELHYQRLEVASSISSSSPMSFMTKTTSASTLTTNAQQNDADENEDDDGFIVSELLLDLLKTVNGDDISNNNSKSDPREILYRIGEKHRQFRGGRYYGSGKKFMVGKEQQDAEELLQALLGLVVVDAQLDSTSSSAESSFHSSAVGGLPFLLQLQSRDQQQHNQEKSQQQWHNVVVDKSIYDNEGSDENKHDEYDDDDDGVFTVVSSIHSGRLFHERISIKLDNDDDDSFDDYSDDDEHNLVIPVPLEIMSANDKQEQLKQMQQRRQQQESIMSSLSTLPPSFPDESLLKPLDHSYNTINGNNSTNSVLLSSSPSPQLSNDTTYCNGNGYHKKDIVNGDAIADEADSNSTDHKVEEKKQEDFELRIKTIPSDFSAHNFDSDKDKSSSALDNGDSNGTGNTTYDNDNNGNNPNLDLTAVDGLAPSTAMQSGMLKDGYINGSRADRSRNSDNNSMSASVQIMMSTMSSITPSPLCGWLGSALQCRVCHHVRPIQNAPFLDIPIVPTAVSNFLSRTSSSAKRQALSQPFPACTLDECLMEFTSVERVHDVECLNCTIQTEIHEVDKEVSMLQDAVNMMIKQEEKRRRKKRIAGNNNDCGGEEENVKGLRFELVEANSQLQLLKNMDPDDPDSLEKYYQHKNKMNNSKGYGDDIGLSDSENDNYDGGSGEGTATKSSDTTSLLKKKLHRCDANKCLLLTRLPAVLCIHVQRRYYDPIANRMCKTVQHVDFPEIFDLSPYSAYGGGCKTGTPWAGGKQQQQQPPISKAVERGQKKNPILYRLTCIIEHRGGAFAGHYAAYRRGPPPMSSVANNSNSSNNESSNTWYRVSDEVVQPIPWMEVKKCQAYMLFYEAM